MDISIMLENVKYNFRVGAILEYNNKVLIEQGDENSYAVIPGGRVKLLEDTAVTILRELKEELGIDFGVIDSKLISVIENFFILDNTQYHELYFIYKYHLDSDFGIVDGMQNLDSHSSKYYWKKIDELDKVRMLPVELKEVAKLNEFKKFVVRD